MTSFTSTSPFVRAAGSGARMLLAFTVLLGLAYPLAITGASQLAMPWQAQGSLITAQGEPTTSRADAVGSAIIGQPFAGDGWFHPRPSAAGEGYDPLASGGTNLGPFNEDLIASISDRQQALAAELDVPVLDLPADAVTASASGLDPAISPAYAALQVPRIAAARGLAESDVSALVHEHTTDRTGGMLGDPYVTVLPLNVALEQAAPTGTMEP